MLRNLPQPLNPRILHGNIRDQSLGYSLVDQGCALFLEQFDLALLLLDQPVDLGGLAIQEVGDGLLFGEWGNGYWVVPKYFCID